MKTRNIFLFLLGLVASITVGAFVVSASVVDRVFFDEPVDAIVFTWENGKGNIIFRTYNSSGWSPWYQTGEGEADFRDEDLPAYDTGHRESHPILVNGATAVQWKGNEVNDVQVTPILETSPSPSPLRRGGFLAMTRNFLARAAATATSVFSRSDSDPINIPSTPGPAAALPIDPATPAPPFRIIPRAEWIPSADRLDDATTAARWPNEYQSPTQFILHHTGIALRDANNDGALSATDFRTLAQAIYTWQAKQKGWADLGYQFLVDPFGYVYEGRAGGDGNVGGHTIRSAQCTKFGTRSEIGFNTGTIGIAVLGNYEFDTLTEAAKESLATLVARKSYEFQMAPTIVGHGDIDCTLCPGAALRSALPEIRTRIQTKYNELVAEGYAWKATLLSQSQTEVNLKDGESTTVTFTFRNDGNTVWRNYPSTPTYLATSVAMRSLTALDSVRTSNVTASVRPHPPLSYKERENMRIGWQGVSDAGHVEPSAGWVSPIASGIGAGETRVRPVAGTGRTIPQTACPDRTRCDPYHQQQPPTPIVASFFGMPESVNSTQPTYQTSIGTPVSSPAAPSAPEKPSPLAPFPLALASSSAPNVKPGETATYTVTVRPSSSIARDIRSFVVAVGDKGYIPDSETTLTVNNLSISYGAALAEHTIPNTWMVGGTKKVTVLYANTGAETWKQADVRLRIADATTPGRPSTFYHQSWKRGLALAADVPPGGAGLFTFTLDAATLGTFTHDLYLARTVRMDGAPDVILGEEIIPGSKQTISTSVDSEWKGAVVKNTFPTDMRRRRTPMTLTIKNTGTKNWTQGRGTTKLIVSNENGGQSSLYDRRDWLSQTDAAWLREPRVRPKTKGTFSFIINPSKTGPVISRLRLETNGVPVYLDNKRDILIQTTVKK